MKSEAAISDLGLSYKVVLVGDSGVGKTNLASRYVFNKFSFENNTTIGVEYFSKNITFDDIKIKIHIWDSAGQERFRSITKCYYRGAKGAFVVFDITKPESFENTEKWIEELLNTGDKDLIVYVLGNKVDLDKHRKICFEQAKFKIEQRSKKIIYNLKCLFFGCFFCLVLK
jgi:small GTP-binding protein